MTGSRIADDTGFEQIELAAPVHMPLHQLELGDLTFGLGVGPDCCNGGLDGKVIASKPVGERRDHLDLRCASVVADLRKFLDASLAKSSRKSKLADAIRYALTRWTGLSRFLDDGRIEIDSNTVERSIRSLALNRKNALFAGSDQGGDHWAVIASLIETCKLNRVDPQAWLSATLTRLVAGHPASALDQLMPWTGAPDVA